MARELVGASALRNAIAFLIANHFFQVPRAIDGGQLIEQSALL
jgi:hypothetical protein